MTWSIFSIVLGLVALVAIWKVAQSFSANKYLSEISAGMSKAEAENEYDRCMTVVALRFNMGGRSGIKQKHASEMLERAVWMQDRINALDGLPNGPAARLHIRSGLLKFLKSKI